MVDQHQVSSIITAAICDAHKNHPDGRMDPEEAKQIAKCIVEALADGGLQIVPVSKINGINLTPPISRCFIVKGKENAGARCALGRGYFFRARLCPEGNASPP
jgi:hypothetical protein